MVPAARILEKAQRDRRRPHRAVRAHHAVARGDDPRRRPRWSARGSRSRCSSAARRRRGPTPRSKIAPAYSRAGRPRHRRVAGGRRRRRARRAPTAREAFVAGDPRRVRDGPARARGIASQGEAADASPRRARTACRSTGPAVTPPRPTFLGPRTFDDYPLAELVELHRLDAVLHDLGAARRLPGDPRRPAARAPRRATSTATRWRCSTGSSARGGCTANAVVGFWPAQQRRRRRHRGLVRRRPPASRGPSFRTLRQQMAKPDGRPNVALADFVGPAETRRRRLHRRVRGHGRASASTRSSPSSRRPTTTTRRSSPRRSPIGWPRRSPSGSTSASGASCGATRPTRRSTNADLIAERYQGIRPGARLPGLPRPHREGDAVRPARGGVAGRHPADRVVRDVAGRRGLAATTCGTRTSHYFGVGRIGRDQLADYAARKGVPLDEAERWLAPNLVDEE